MNHNAIMILCAAVSIIAVIYAVYSFIEIILDRRRQEEIVKGLEYRRKYGLFDIVQYISTQKCLKDLSWKKQKNTGPRPDTFHRNLAFIDYFDENSELIIDKGSMK